MIRDEQAIREVVTAFETNWNRHDMEAFAALFGEDADFVNVVGMWWRGRPEIHAAHAASHHAIFKDSRLTIRETVVRILVPGVAVTRSTWDLVGHCTPQGDPLPRRSGILTHVLKRDGEGWRIVASQNTDIVSPG